MRRLFITLQICLLLLLGGWGTTAWAATSLLSEASGPAPPAASATLPLTKIVLYASGVGYFQRDGQLEGRVQVSLHFKTDQINDMLKSMVVQDFDGGQVGTVTYDARDPIAKTLKSFGLDLTDNASLGHLLWQMRGEKVEVTTPSPIQGLILGVETKKEPAKNGEVLEVEYLNLWTESGLRSIALPHIQTLQIANEHLQAELRQALAVLAASHDTQKKTVTLTFDGTGRRRIRVAYITETPVWKTSYRLVLSDTEAPWLQGWALVENTTDNDWREVHLTLISGRPLSFTMDMYEPLYAQRPAVAPSVYAALRPPVYEQALETPEDKGRTSRRASGAGDGQDSKRAEVDALRRAPAREPAAPPVMATTPMPALSPPPSEPPMALEQGVVAAAQAGEMGALFAYAITAPVSLERQKSAMLPILNTSVQGTKVAIYNQRVHAKHPLHGVRLTNATAVHLVQGPLTVFDGGVYAGDARIDDIPPGQERLLSYAVDLQTEVESISTTEQPTLVTVSLVKGTLVASQKALAEQTYTIKNRDEKPRLVLIEHPFRPEWQLTDTPTPAERTKDVYRFAVPVEAGQKAQLRVREERPLQQTVELTNAGTDVIASYVRATRVSAKVQEALQRVITLREKADQTGQQRRRLEQQIQEISQEQGRMRENMGKLGQNSELYGRYVRKLDQQETEIEKIRKELEALKTAEVQQRKELQDYLLSLDLS